MDEFEMGDMAKERRERIRKDFESAYEMTDLGNYRDLEQLNTLYGKLDSKLSSEGDADNRAVLKDMLDRVRRRRAALASDTHHVPGKADRLREIRKELEKKYGYYTLQGTRDIHLLDTAIARLEQDVSVEEDPIKSRAMGQVMDRLINRKRIITYSEPTDTTGFNIEGRPAPHTPTMPRVDTDLLSEKSRAWREKNRKEKLRSPDGSRSDLETPAISFLESICKKVGVTEPVFPEDLVFNGATYRGDPRSGLLYKIVNGRQVLVWDGNGFTDTPDGRTFRSMVLGLRTQPFVPSGSPLIAEAERVSSELSNIRKTPDNTPNNTDAKTKEPSAEAKAKAKREKKEGKQPKTKLGPDTKIPGTGNTNLPSVPADRPTVIEEGPSGEKGPSNYITDNEFLSEDQKRVIMGVLVNGIVPEDGGKIDVNDRYRMYVEYDSKSTGNRIEIARLKLARGLADATGAEQGLKNALDYAIERCVEANNRVEKFKRELKNAMSPEQRQDLESLERTKEYKRTLKELKILEDQANAVTTEIDDTGKLERFKRFVKDNNVGLAGITIGIAAIITTIVIGSRKAIAAGGRGLGKFGKAVASFGKKVWPVLAPIFSALATIIGWGAKGVSWLASNLWAVAILIAIALFNYVRERANKTNSRRK